MVYVPGLHNAGGRIAPLYVASTAGVWEMDSTGHRAVVFDMSDDPERWQGTLSNLSFFLGPLLPPRSQELDPATAATLVELIGHYRAEYEGFLARHADATAATADARDVLQRRRQAAVDRNGRHRARPAATWGMEIRRLYEREMVSLTEIEAALKQ